MSDAGAGRRADGGRAVGEVAEGVTLLKNVRVEVRDGTRLAADVYMPTSALRGGSPGLAASWTTSRTARTRSTPARAPTMYLARAGLHRGPRRHPRHRRVRGREHRRVHAAGAADGADAIEWFAAQPWCDGHVNMMGISYGGFTALQVAAHAAAAPDVDHPDVLHGRSLHGRLPLPRRAAAHVLRHRLVRHTDDRVERAAARSRVVARRLGGGLGASTSPTTSRTCSSGCGTRPTGRTGATAPSGDMRRSHRGARVPDRRLARRLSEPAAAALSQALAGAREGARRAVESRLPDGAIPGPRIDYLHEVVRWLDHWCKGSDNGVMAEPPVVVLHAGVRSRRSSTGSSPRASGAPRRRGRRRARARA